MFYVSRGDKRLLYDRIFPKIRLNDFVTYLPLLVKAAAVRRFIPNHQRWLKGGSLSALYICGVVDLFSFGFFV